MNNISLDGSFIRVINEIIEYDYANNTPYNDIYNKLKNYIKLENKDKIKTKIEKSDSTLTSITSEKKCGTHSYTLKNKYGVKHICIFHHEINIYLIHEKSFIEIGYVVKDYQVVEQNSELRLIGNRIIYRIFNNDCQSFECSCYDLCSCYTEFIKQGNMNHYYKYCYTCLDATNTTLDTNMILNKYAIQRDYVFKYLFNAINLMLDILPDILQKIVIEYCEEDHSIFDIKYGVNDDRLYDSLFREDYFDFKTDLKIVTKEYDIIIYKSIRI